MQISGKLSYVQIQLHQKFECVVIRSNFLSV